MANTPYDCAIIGGGLAGLCLSIQLARAKHSVILFEKESYPFHKVCGEYIAMESWDFLENMGVPLSKMNLPRINQLKISAPNGNVIEHELQAGGFGISRFTLDALLVDLAVKAGVTVLSKTKVEDVAFVDNAFSLKTKEHNYSAKLVCGAFGKRANMDMRLKRSFIENTSDYVAVKYHVKANLPADGIELHNFKDGYCGISKVDNERYCLCYLTSAKNLKANNNSIEQMEKNVLMKNPYLKKYFSEFPSLYERPLVISQINFSKKNSVENHIILLGDAAGLITPLCGNGMSMAMHASKIACRNIDLFLSGKIAREALEGKYTEEWKSTFAKRIKAGRILQGFFGNNFITNWVIRMLKPFPKVVDRLVALTHGEPY